MQKKVRRDLDKGWWLWYNNHNHTEVGSQNGNEFCNQINDNIGVLHDQIAEEANVHFVTPFRVVFNCLTAPQPAAVVKG